MGSRFNWHNQDSGQKYPNNKGLLGAGWRPLSRQFDWDFFIHLVTHDSQELAQKTLDFASDIADSLGRNHYTWWSNILNLFSENMRYELDEFLEYITPEPPFPDRGAEEVLRVETPVKKVVDRNSIPIDYVLSRLQEITLLKVLDFLGSPDLITQQYQERHFYCPIERFISWENLEVLGNVYAYWSQYQVWLEIYPMEKHQRCYCLMSDNIQPLINKSTYNLAVMLSGYQSRVGKVNSLYSISSFPSNIQQFTDVVQQAVWDNDRLAVLVHGEPGTGKTVWAQAVAQEIMVPLGYVIFILDHDGVENFVPPSYLERICLIINEADNLAQNRAEQVAQTNNKTEHILSLLDGTLYQSVIDDSLKQPLQKLVVLMTCNTIDRLDPAVLRKGRVDLTCEFTRRFV